MVYDCLIVDDAVDLGKATCEYLDMFDVKALHVTNSQDCLQVLIEHTVKMIILDINLEKESGFTLCKEIRKFSRMPILFISARQSDDDVIIALNIGEDDYLKKPYSLGVLLAKVKVMLKRMEEQSIQVTEKQAGILIDTTGMKVYVGGQEVRFIS